jgi:small subunit ribosomal protein S6
MTDKSRTYEAFYIVRPEFSDGDVQKIADRFKTVVVDHGGAVESAGKWDRRKLAYEIKGCKEGTYVLMSFTAPAAVPAELNRLMRISDDVLRQIILIQEKPKPEAPAEVAAASAPAAAGEPLEAAPATSE